MNRSFCGDDCVAMSFTYTDSANALGGGPKT